MSAENSLDPHSIASRIVHFLANLQGMDEYQPAAAIAAIDLATGTIVWPDAGFPDGAMLKVQFGSGSTITVSIHTYKLVETFLIRHAQMLAVSESRGSVAQHYKDIKEHFAIKTGFGLE
jgi:hypothetical protein